MTPRSCHIFPKVFICISDFKKQCWEHDIIQTTDEIFPDRLSIEGWGAAVWLKAKTGMQTSIKDEY